MRYLYVFPAGREDGDRPSVGGDRPPGGLYDDSGLALPADGALQDRLEASAGDGVRDVHQEFRMDTAHAGERCVPLCSGAVRDGSAPGRGDRGDRVYPFQDTEHALGRVPSRAGSVKVQDPSVCPGVHPGQLSLICACIRDREE